MLFCVLGSNVDDETLAVFLIQPFAHLLTIPVIKMDTEVFAASVPMLRLPSHVSHVFPPSMENSGLCRSAGRLSVITTCSAVSVPKLLIVSV